MKIIKIAFIFVICNYFIISLDAQSNIGNDDNNLCIELLERNLSNNSYNDSIKIIIKSCIEKLKKQKQNDSARDIFKIIVAALVGFALGRINTWLDTKKKRKEKLVLYCQDALINLTNFKSIYQQLDFMNLYSFESIENTSLKTLEQLFSAIEVYLKNPVDAKREVILTSKLDKFNEYFTSTNYNTLYRSYKELNHYCSIRFNNYIKIINEDILINQLIANISAIIVEES